MLQHKVSEMSPAQRAGHLLELVDDPPAGEGIGLPVRKVEACWVLHEVGCAATERCQACVLRLM